jgi:hypothetical protein
LIILIILGEEYNLWSCEAGWHCFSLGSYLRDLKCVHFIWTGWATAPHNFFSFQVITRIYAWRRLEANVYVCVSHILTWSFNPWIGVECSWVCTRLKP